jgi:hypothetical protein
MKLRKLMGATVAASIALGSVLPTTAFAAPAAPVVPGLAFGQGATWVPWTIFGCAGGIIVSALAANYRDGRELTAPEAWTCGMLFWFSPPKPRKRH